MRGLDLRGTVGARLRARWRWLVAVPAVILPAELILAGTSPSDATSLAGPLPLLAVFLLFLPLVGGWVGDELRSGAVLFWLQTPHSPLVLYGVRFGGVAAAAALLSLAVPAATAALLAAAGHPDVARPILVRMPGVALNLMVLGVLVWAVAGWGVRGDAWAGPLVGGALLALELVARLQPEWLGPLAGPADLVGVPVDDLAIAARVLAGNAGDGAAFSRVAPWIVLWVAVGALGVHRSAHRASVADRGS